MDARILSNQEAFPVFKQILNLSPLKIGNACLKRDTFLGYHLCESHLECHRGFPRLDDYYVKVLTLKQPSSQTFPLIFGAAPPDATLSMVATGLDYGSSSTKAACTLKAVLGEDTILYFQTFLNDPRGQNLRNRVSHGLTEKRYLNKPLADRLLHILLSLSLVRKQEPVQSKPEK